MKQPRIFVACLLLLALTYYQPAHASVTADKDHGFYDSPFTVIITSKSGSTDIQYTLDCSDPRYSTTAQTATSPVSIKIDPSSTNGRTATPAVVLRAASVLPQGGFGAPVTKTYIFINEVLTQKYPGELWPEVKVDTVDTNSTGGGFGGFFPVTPQEQVYDYEMDSSVVNDSRYKGVIDDALLDIPSISLALDMDSLFDKERGIYQNALNSGAEWERFCSAELINPDGSDGFTINCGIRIRGGWSRHSDCPKHSFRLFFREKYGASKLMFPLFEDEGVAKFDKISLRTAQNYSWSYKAYEGAKCTMIKDVYCRDSQGALGHYYTRSRYYHLYLNGMYWGLYQTQEQADNRFAESYMGGEHLDYDVLSTVNDFTPGSTRDKTVEVEDGTIDLAQKLWTKMLDGFTNTEDYYMVQGLNSDGRTVNPSYERLLDVDNLIDFLLITFYTGNYDSPTPAFSNPPRCNNYQAIINRIEPDGFKWMSHDGEHTMVDLNIDIRVKAVPAIEVDRTGPFNLSDDIRFFNPQRIHQTLCENSDYKMRFADHVFKHFFNEGVFCPEPSKKRYQKRAAQIEKAIIAESARWGDAQVEPARTKDDDWLPELDRIYNEYMPQRTNIVVGQFKKCGLYPSIEPPVFSDEQTIIVRQLTASSGYELTIANPNNSGSIYYTTDGTDPRLAEGKINSTAKNSANTTTITIQTTTLVNARIKTDNEWSALRELLIVIPQEYDDLKITEIHYHPLDEGQTSGDLFEFLELKNIGSKPLNLTGLRFETGITYDFPAGTILEPGHFFVIASNTASFVSRYGFTPNGEYQNQLANSGEKLEIVNPQGTSVLSITYSDDDPWPIAADKDGKSLVPTKANKVQDQNNSTSWIASLAVHGSPGKDDQNSDDTDNIKNKNLIRKNTVCRVGKYRFPIPFENDFQVCIFNVQGKIVANFTEKGKSFYKWNPTTKGLYLIRFKNDLGKQVIRNVQIVN